MVFAHTKAPAGERGITPKGNAETGDSRCGCARTERAWLARQSCERRTETAHTIHSALWHRAATARPRVLTVNRTDCLRLHNCGCRSLPLPMSSGVYGARHLRARPSGGGEKRSANRSHTRCGRAYNRYGDKCQGRTRLRRHANGVVPLQHRNARVSPMQLPPKIPNS